MNALDKLARLVGIEGYEDHPESQIMEGRDAVRADFQRGFLAKDDPGVARHPAGRGHVGGAGQRLRRRRAATRRCAENEMIVEWEHPKAGTVRGVGIPVKFSDTPGEIRRHAPLLGEHTEELLREFAGYSEDEVRELQDAGAVNS
jgi:crotonobetainyl-CoA:carnitine CoA-transferase CaiB-like acyl-CoA transferase